MANEVDEETITELYFESKREVLEDLHEFLVKDIDPRKFFPLFRSNRIIDADDEEEILSEKTTKQKASSFLTMISRKNKDSFDVLCEALLKYPGQLHLLKKLLQKFEEKIQGADDIHHRRQFRQHNHPTFPAPGQLGGPELPSGYYMSFMSEAPPPYTD